MPTYTYGARDPEKACDACRECYEIIQRMSEQSLERCPECGCEIVRFMHATPTVRDSSTKNILSDNNLKKHGFKKLVNRGGGKYDEVV